MGAKEKEQDGQQHMSEPGPGSAPCCGLWGGRAGPTKPRPPVVLPGLQGPNQALSFSRPQLPPAGLPGPVSAATGTAQVTVPWAKVSCHCVRQASVSRLPTAAWWGRYGDRGTSPSSLAYPPQGLAGGPGCGGGPYLLALPAWPH